MHAAHQQSLVVDGLLLIIILAYLGIAFQFWARRRGARGRATTALSQLVVIFVFCAFCGYLPRLVPIPELVLILAHAVLAAAAWAYFFSGQVDRLSLAVDDSDRDTARSAARAREQEEAIAAEAEACARLAEQVGSKVAAGLIRDRMADRQARQQRQAVPSGAAVQPAE